MRVVTLLLTLAVFLLAFGALAQGDEEEEATPVSPEVAALEKKVGILEQQVAYLLQRDAALTKYVLAHEAQGAALLDLARRMRDQGFAARSIPAESRETLLRGLETLGTALQADLPRVTKEQQEMLTAAARIR